MLRLTLGRSRAAQFPPYRDRWKAWREAFSFSNVPETGTFILLNGPYNYILLNNNNDDNNKVKLERKFFINIYLRISCGVTGHGLHLHVVQTPLKIPLGLSCPYADFFAHQIVTHGY